MSLAASSLTIVRLVATTYRSRCLGPGCPRSRYSVVPIQSLLGMNNCPIAQLKSCNCDCTFPLCKKLITFAVSSGRLKDKVVYGPQTFSNFKRATYSTSQSTKAIFSTLIFCGGSHTFSISISPKKKN